MEISLSIYKLLTEDILKYLITALLVLSPVTYGSFQEDELLKKVKTERVINKFWYKETKALVDEINNIYLQEGDLHDMIRDILAKVFGEKVADFFILMLGTETVENSLVDIALAFNRISKAETCDDGVRDAAGAIAYLGTYVAIQYLIIQRGVIVPIASDVAGKAAKTAVQFTIDLFALDTKLCNKIHTSVVTDCFPDRSVAWEN